MSPEGSDNSTNSLSTVSTKQFLVSRCCLLSMRTVISPLRINMRECTLLRENGRNSCRPASIFQKANPSSSAWQCVFRCVNS